MKCKAKVYQSGMFTSTGCSNKAVTEAGFCRVHDPDCQEERRKKRGPTAEEIRWEDRRLERKRTKDLERALRAVLIRSENYQAKIAPGGHELLDDEQGRFELHWRHGAIIIKEVD